MEMEISKFNKQEHQERGINTRKLIVVEERQGHITRKYWRPTLLESIDNEKKKKKGATKT